MFKLILILIITTILFLYNCIRAYERRYADPIEFITDCSRMCFFGGITVGICFSLPYIICN